MRKGSIAFSLFWLSAGWLILALAGTAFLLTDLYSRALDTNLTNQLKFDIDTLSSAILDSTDPSFGDVSVNDPRFTRASTAGTGSSATNSATCWRPRARRWAACRRR